MTNVLIIVCTIAAICTVETMVISSRTRTRWTKRLLNRSYRRWSKTNKIPKRNCNGSRGRSVA